MPILEGTHMWKPTYSTKGEEKHCWMKASYCLLPPLDPPMMPLYWLFNVRTTSLHIYCNTINHGARFDRNTVTPLKRNLFKGVHIVHHNPICDIMLQTYRMLHVCMCICCFSMVIMQNFSILLIHLLAKRHNPSNSRGKIVCKIVKMIGNLYTKL